ncbi:MAG TPA: 50S ribosomal protein L22 [Methanomicrobiales archaeon]|nr:50S ribosomal protein L22 [Methanomicrobiales archaeon]
MARTGYSTEIEGEDIARAKANEEDISPKHAFEIARFIKKMRTDDAIEYLNQVVSLEKAIPIRVYNKKVPHRRGLGGWHTGRYPQKAAKVFIKLLNAAQKNAEYIGLDAANLKIVHVQANRGRRHEAFFPRAMGRATPKNRETVNLEVIVKEVA